MYDRQQSKEILNEFSLGDFANKFKRMEEDDQSVILGKILNVNTDKMIKRMNRSNNKNVKDILKTKGDFSRFTGYKDIESIITFIDRQVGMKNNVPNDLAETLTNIKKGIGLLEKESRHFKKAFTSGNDLLQIMYMTLVSVISFLTLKLLTTYFKHENDGYGVNLVMENRNMNLAASLENDTLTKLLSQYTNGDLSKLISGRVSLSEGPIADFIEYLVNSENGGKDSLSSKLFGADGVITLKKLDTPTAKIGGVIILAIGAIIGMRHFYIKFLEFRIFFSDSLRDAANIISETSSTVSNPKVKERQIKAAERYRNLADKIDLDSSVSQTKAGREIERDNKDIEREIGGMEFDI